MFLLRQPVDCRKHLPHLISLGFPPVVLDINPRIALPRCLVDTVTATLLPWLTEVVIADSTQIGESNVLRAIAQCCNQNVYTRHSITIGTIVKVKKRVSADLIRWLDYANASTNERTWIACVACSAVQPAGSGALTVRLRPAGRSK